LVKYNGERIWARLPDGVELDVRRSRDGALVIHHDDRVAPDALPLVDLDSARSRQRLRGCRRWDEAWHALGPATLLNIEIKNDPSEADHDAAHSIARTVTDWIDYPRHRGRLLVSSFNWDTLDALRRVAPQTPTGLLAGESLDPFSVVARAATGGHASVNLPLSRTLSDAERIVSAAGDIAVLVWTVNDPNTARSLAAAGISGIFTDDPALMVSTLSGRS